MPITPGINHPDCESRRSNLWTDLERRHDSVVAPGYSCFSLHDHCAGMHAILSSSCVSRVLTCFADRARQRDGKGVPASVLGLAVGRG
jgi:hypothetical protein